MPAQAHALGVAVQISGSGHDGPNRLRYVERETGEAIHAGDPRLQGLLPAEWPWLDHAGGLDLYRDDDGNPGCHSACLHCESPPAVPAPGPWVLARPGPCAGDRRYLASEDGGHQVWATSSDRWARRFATADEALAWQTRVREWGRCRTAEDFEPTRLGGGDGDEQAVGLAGASDDAIRDLARGWEPGDSDPGPGGPSDLIPVPQIPPALFAYLDRLVVAGLNAASCGDLGAVHQILGELRGGLRVAAGRIGEAPR
jgi:hypothetical protein